MTQKKYICHLLAKMSFLLGLLLPLSALCATHVSVTVTSGYSFRRYTTQDGLPQMLTECIHQDKMGYIWIGTLSGFVRYDGFEFVPYLKGGRPENIVAFHEDKYGVTALGFRRKHLAKEGGQTDTQPLNSRGMLLNNFNSSSLPPDYFLLENEQEQEREICRLTANGTETVLRSPLLDEMDACRRVFADTTDGTFYIPTAERTYRIKADGTQLPALLATQGYSMLRTDNMLYLFAADGVYSCHGASTQRIIPFHFLAPDYGIGACADRQGNIYLHDAHNLYRFNPTKNKVEQLVNGINLIRQMYIDREGNIWLATYQGVYNFFRLNFMNHTLTDRNDILRAIGITSEGDLICGTLNGKLLEGNTAKELHPVHYPNSKDNYFLPYTARIGQTIYLLGQGDVLAYEDTRRQWLNLPYLNYRFLAGYGDSLLVATRQELFITDRRGHILNTHKGLRDIFCACPDGYGNLYVGTAYGPVRISGNKQVAIHQPEEGIPCTTMTTTLQGEILIASGEKLYTVRNDSAIMIHDYESPIRSICQTKDNYLIVAVVNGLYITDNRLLQTMFFNRYNGFTGIEPLVAHIAEADDGTIWIPCVDRTVSFRSRDLTYQYTVPNLEMVSIEASADNVDWQSLPISSRQITLSYPMRHLRFSFIAVSHSATGNVYYRYRLKGLQKQWSEPQSAREVQFNNLLPGRYRLEVEASIGAIASPAIYIDLHLRPALWQQPWFWIISGLLIAGGIWALTFHYYKRHEQKQTQRLKRETMLNNLLLKSIRLKSIPHFNSNVLAGIEYFILNHSVEEANKYLALYSRFTNTLLMDVDKPSRSLAKELEYASLYLTLEQLRYGDNLAYDICIDPKADTSVQVPNMMLHTYCENAVKHGLRNKRGRGHLLIEVKARTGGICVSVTDDGVGREAAAILSGTSTKQGLNIMEQQIELYNQRNTEHIVQTVTDLKDKNGNACGTRFELYIPYHYNYF